MGEQAFKCDKCPRRYKNMRSLNYHKRNECGIKFKCQWCSKEYESKSGLHSHNLFRCRGTNS